MNTVDVSEINAWANVLSALGQNGHNAATVNQSVLRELTVLVKKRLEKISKF